MQIKIQCLCSHEFRIDDKFAGNDVQCPKCKAVVTVPELARETPDEPKTTRRNVSLRVAIPIIFASLTVFIGLGWYFIREPQSVMGGAEFSNAMRNGPRNPVIIERTEILYPPVPQTPHSSSTGTDLSNAAPPSSPPELNTVDQGFENGLRQEPRSDGSMLYRLNQVSWASAYDSETGRIATTNDEKGIVIYSIDDLKQGNTTPTAVLKCDGEPTAVCLKKINSESFFAFGSWQHSKITLVNTTTLEVAEIFEIPSESNIGSIICSSNPEDPYIYYLASRQTVKSPYFIFGRVHIEKKEVEQLRPAYLFDARISADGTRIHGKRQAKIGSKYEHSNSSWYGLGRFASRVETKEEDIPLKTTSGASLRVMGDNVAIENTILEPAFDGTNQLSYALGRQVDFEPLTRFESAPIAFGATDKGLAFGYWGTGKKIVEFELPPTLRRPISQGKMPKWNTDLRNKQRVGSQIGIANLDGYVDEKRQLGIAVIDDYLMLIPYNSLNLLQPHPLEFSLERPGLGSIGEQIKIPVPELSLQKKIMFEFSFSKNLQKDDQVEQLALPQLIDGNICWTPNQKHLGKHNLLVTAKVGNEKREWIWPIEIIYRPSEDKFDFYVQGIVGIPGTTNMVVWGIPNDGIEFRYGSNRILNGLANRSILRIYDTSKDNLIKSVELPYEINSVAIHSTGIYATSMNAKTKLLFDSPQGRILHFDRESLDLIDAILMDVPQENPSTLLKNRLEFHKVNTLAVKNRPTNSFTNTWESDYHISLPSFTVLRRPAASKLATLDDSTTIEDGILWKTLTKKPLLLIDQTPFLKPPKDPQNKRINPPSPVFHSKQIVPGLYIPELQAQVRSTQGNLMVFSPNQDPNSQEVDILAVIEFKNQQTRDDDRPNPKPLVSRILESENYESVFRDHLYCTNEGKVFRFPLSSLPSGPAVFAFEEKQDHFVIPAGKKLKWNYRANGANHYELTVYMHALAPTILNTNRNSMEEEGSAIKVIQLESTDGQFEFEVKQETAIQTTINYLKPHFRYSSKNLIMQEIVKMIQAMEAPYKNLTLHSPSTLPAAATVVVTAKHADGNQTAELCHLVLIETPLDILLPKIEQALNPKLKSR
jgi:hypothetical protein